MEEGVDSVDGLGVASRAASIRANAVLEGKLIKREGKSYYNFKTVDLDVKLGDYKLQMDGLFRDNRILGKDWSSWLA